MDYHSGRLDSAPAVVKLSLPDIMPEVITIAPKSVSHTLMRNGRSSMIMAAIMIITGRNGKNIPHKTIYLNREEKVF